MKSFLSILSIIYISSLLCAETIYTAKTEGVEFYIRGAGPNNERIIVETVRRDKNGSLLFETKGASIANVETADLDTDGYPEVYIHLLSPGSGSYGSIIAVEAAGNRGAIRIAIPKLEPDSRESKGYMGHDSFFTDRGYLVRSFPIYRKADPNCCPSGGVRKIYYRLLKTGAKVRLKAVKSEDIKTARTNSRNSSEEDMREKIISLAVSKIGQSYRSGEAGPEHFDCSGLMYYIFRENGIEIPRSSIEQSKTGPRLDRSQIKRGDLLFFDTSDRGFINHSALYLGGGKFIHSSSGRAYAVTISELDSGFYKDRFLFGVDILYAKRYNRRKYLKERPGYLRIRHRERSGRNLGAHNRIETESAKR